MRLFSSVHLLLLSYIIAIIIFWGISLQRQNNQIHELQLRAMRGEVDSALHPSLYQQKVDALSKVQSARTAQYTGEGATFLIVILIGAAVVYSSFSRRIRLSRQQNNFMLSVTHELKSPIAAIKLNLQTLEKHQLNEDKRGQLVDRCIKESNRLNDLCNNMLFASQMEGGMYKFAKEPMDLSVLVEDAVDDYAQRYPRKFEQDIEVGCRITGDKVMMQMAINNLLENAIKYTPGDKPIAIGLDMKDGKAIVSVADQGAGIPDSEKKKIFNKFYRVGNEDSRKTKGTGLGLYLTNKIVMQHKGHIGVKNNEPTGTVFEIFLPIH